MFECNLKDVCGIPLHRCTRCGGECFNLNDAPITGEQLSVFTTDLGLAEAYGVKRLAVHACGDGGAGLAMLFGVMPMERVALVKQRLEEAQQQAAEQQTDSSSNKGLN
jgi:hypothetical protein